MKKYLFLIFPLLLISAFVYAQPEKSVYTPAQKQQARETAEMNRHYNEIKPGGNAGSTGTISGDYDSYGGADYSNMKGINAAEARQKAIADEYKAKENKLIKIIADKKIEKTKENYYRVINAALQAGFNNYWAERTFGDSPEKFEIYIGNSNYVIQKYFGSSSNTIIGSGKPQKVTAIIHDTKFGSGNEVHPESFRAITESHQKSGYKKFDSIAGFIKAIIDDGPNNFNSITDKTTQRSYSICECDYSYGLKYYWKDYEALENAAFKSNGNDIWKYPFINFKTRGKSLDEYKQLLANSVKELLVTYMYVHKTDTLNNDRFSKLTFKKEFQQDSKFMYQVSMQVKQDNGAAIFIMKIFKSDVVASDDPIVTSKPSLKGVKLTISANSSIAQKVMIINTKQVYSSINEIQCLDWSWATAQQRNLCGAKGWGDFKPKNGDVGEIVSESKHCFTDARVIIVKVGDYYVPIGDEALVFEN